MMEPARIGKHPSRMRFLLSLRLAIQCLAIQCLAMPLFAGDGVPPLRSALDYPAHQDAKLGGGLAAIGASIVPPDQVRKMFSNGIARDFVIVEVAMFPAEHSRDTNGSFEADRFDFGLKIGDRITHAEAPGAVTNPTGPRGPDLGAPNSKINVEHEVGVIYSRTNDPYNGKRSGVGVYDGTTVSNAPAQPTPKSPASVDPRDLEVKLRDKALPEGPTQKAVAGYLYFPVSKKHKGDTIELQYTRGEVELDLKFPK